MRTNQRQPFRKLSWYCTSVQLEQECGASQFNETPSPISKKNDNAKIKCPNSRNGSPAILTWSSRSTTIIWMFTNDIFQKIRRHFPPSARNRRMPRRIPSDVVQLLRARGVNPRIGHQSELQRGREERCMHSHWRPNRLRTLSQVVEKMGNPRHYHR